jgi:putative phage-type endonuclease
MEQRTTEWHAARLGQTTASRIADIVARTKSGYSTSRANYAAQLVCERLTGVAAEPFVNSAMQWGSEKEPEAQRLYEFEHDAEVVKVGFIDHPRIAMSGASPDGFIGDAGLVEVKCPITSTHIETVLGRSVPGKYLAQMQWQMAVTGRQWCDFVSYDPRLPLALRLFVSRVHRDDALIGELEGEVASFLAEIDATLAKLQDFACQREVEGQRSAA